jgi:hypothetical protein
MPDVRTNAIMPRGETNGLVSIAGVLADEAAGRAPRKLRAALVLFDARRLTIDADTREEVVTIRIRRAELILPGDLPEAEKLIRRSSEDRLGATVLPLDLEREIETTFQGLDLDPDHPDAEGDPADAELAAMAGDGTTGPDEVVEADIVDDDPDDDDDDQGDDDGGDWGDGYPEGQR